MTSVKCHDVALATMLLPDGSRGRKNRAVAHRFEQFRKDFVTEHVYLGDSSKNVHTKNLLEDSLTAKLRQNFPTGCTKKTTMRKHIERQNLKNIANLRNREKYTDNASVATKQCHFRNQTNMNPNATTPSANTNNSSRSVFITSRASSCGDIRDERGPVKPDTGNTHIRLLFRPTQLKPPKDALDAVKVTLQNGVFLPYDKYADPPRKARLRSPFVGREQGYEIITIEDCEGSEEDYDEASDDDGNPDSDCIEKRGMSTTNPGRHVSFSAPCSSSKDRGTVFDKDNVVYNQSKAESFRQIGQHSGLKLAKKPTCLPSVNNNAVDVIGVRWDGFKTDDSALFQRSKTFSNGNVSRVLHPVSVGLDRNRTSISHKKWAVIPAQSYDGMKEWADKFAIVKRETILNRRGD